MRIELKEAHKAAGAGLPILFKGDSRYPAEVYAYIRSIELQYIPKVAVSVLLQCRTDRSALASVWKDMNLCEVISSCSECPVHGTGEPCGQCKLNQRKLAGNES